MWPTHVQQNKIDFDFKSSTAENCSDPSVTCSRNSSSSDPLTKKSPDSKRSLPVDETCLNANSNNNSKPSFRTPSPSSSKIPRLSSDEPKKNNLQSSSNQNPFDSLHLSALQKQV